MPADAKKAPSYSELSENSADKTLFYKNYPLFFVLFLCFLSLWEKMQQKKRAYIEAILNEKFEKCL